MLKGSELETLESREQFQFDTRFRVLPKNFGVYGGEKVFDVEEIVVATDTLPFDDYITVRASITWPAASSGTTRWFEDAVDFARSLGIKRFGVAGGACCRRWRADAGDGRQVLDDFVAETRTSCSRRREACIEFYSRRGELRAAAAAATIGDNLMYKYRAIASFFLWQRGLRAHERDGTRALLRAHPRRRGGGARLRAPAGTTSTPTPSCSTPAATTRDPILCPRRGRLRLNYGFASWIAQGDLADPSAYRYEGPTEVEFRLSDEGRRKLESALAVWTTHIRALSKLVTRIKVDWQVREWCCPGPSTGRSRRSAWPGRWERRARP